MKIIYKNKEGRKKILELYDRQLKRLAVPYKDVYVRTSFGKTHLIETGSPTGEPLLVFHGGNATTAYNLLACGFLLEDFHIFAVDTIGHPGKSAETCLSAFNYDYGKWAGEGQKSHAVCSRRDPECSRYKKRRYDVSHDPVPDH